MTPSFSIRFLGRSWRSGRSPASALSQFDAEADDSSLCNLKLCGEITHAYASISMLRPNVSTQFLKKATNIFP